MTSALANRGRHSDFTILYCQKLDLHNWVDGYSSFTIFKLSSLIER